MGIRGLQTFITETILPFKDIELHDCGIVLDGNSIYHQMYQEYDLACEFSGEYDQFYQCCRTLFDSCRKCQINVIVVFDGAQLDSLKLSTNIERAKESTKKSTASSKTALSPVLLRQTFISVLDAMQVPYVSALGEGDDECVSLANRLRYYLMATDSDYYCYNLRLGYIPFESVNLPAEERNGLFYLSAQSYHINSLLQKFKGLRQETLALACSLCGNDYIDRRSTGEIIRYINGSLKSSKQLQGAQSLQTKNLWNAMQWMRKRSNVDDALNHLLTQVNPSSSDELRKRIHEAMLCYLEPSDTLIWRFLSLNKMNTNLLRNSDLVQLARSYLDTLDMNDQQLRDYMDNNCRSIKSKCGRLLPQFLVDAVTDLRLSPSFLEVLIHRELICKSHVEVQDDESIYKHAMPINLPCFAILLRWDQEPNDLTVVVHHREQDQLKKVLYPLDYHDGHLPELEQIWSIMTLDERQYFVRKYLQIPNELVQQWQHIPSDYHLWLMILHYWYTKRRLLPVYLYAVIVCLMKYVFLRNDDDSELVRGQFHPFFAAFGTHQTSLQIDSATHDAIVIKLEEISNKVKKKVKLNPRIIHELNCLQTTYMYALKMNGFFQEPFRCPVYPQHFISGSLFYGFVEHYKTKNHLNALPDSMRALFQNDPFLVNFAHDLFTSIVQSDPGKGPMMSASNIHIHAHTTTSQKWIYPVLLVYYSSDGDRLYSIFDHLTDSHVRPSVSTNECDETIDLSDEITSLVLQLSSASTEKRDRLLNHYSSFDHIKSIYLLGKSPQDSQAHKSFFATFHKVCLFCEDEGQLAVRWILEMANECRIRSTQIAKEGDIVDARSYFQRAIALYDRLTEFIDESK